MFRNFAMSLIGTVVLSTLACGAGDPNDTVICPPNALCVASTATDTTTGTDTGTGVATSTVTSTPTATDTNTATATNTTVSSIPSWCTANYVPSYAEAGNPLSFSVISLGTWHTIDSSGAEWVLNCTEKSTDGETSCCGSLLSEATIWAAPSFTNWRGFSMQRCIAWAASSTSAPSISGTGYTFDPTISRIDLTGSSLPTWNPAGSITIAACQ